MLKSRVSVASSPCRLRSPVATPATDSTDARRLVLIADRHDREREA
jgi:hypothetical protein